MKVTQVVNKLDEWDEGDITEKVNDKKVCYFALVLVLLYKNQKYCNQNLKTLLPENICLARTSFSLFILNKLPI